MEYRYSNRPGALLESQSQPTRHADLTALATTSAKKTRKKQSPLGDGRPRLDSKIPAATIELVPASVALGHEVIPLEFDGECLVCAAVDPNDLAVTDKLRFLLAKDIRLVAVPRREIQKWLEYYYGAARAVACLVSDLGESADSMLQEFTDTSTYFAESDLDDELAVAPSRMVMSPAIPGVVAMRQPRQTPARGISGYAPLAEETSMSLFYVVPDGKRVLMTRRDGSVQILVGPKRVWRVGRRFEPMTHFVAHPGQYLISRFRDGKQEHLPGPAEMWFDPRIHESIHVEEAVQLANKEAVVVYSRSEDGKSTTRRIVNGPTLFVPQPGEWLHTFSWHASKGGSRGVEKIPNALVFQKLWLMPDQMYHDVRDVRTSDDAVLTIRLMIFFELIDINRMLEATHDPIGDFVNAATADTIEFVGQHDFESFKHNTAALNVLSTYRQLTARATQCGYQIANVVYRGYGAADSLQQMHNQAIEARTKLQLDRATEQQAQDLENYRLESQLLRAGKRRVEQTDEVRHELELARARAENELQLRDRQRAFLREQRMQDAKTNHDVEQLAAAQQQAHLRALSEMGVNLTAYLTQGRADRVIELRGTAAPHLHVDRLDGQSTNGESH